MSNKAKNIVTGFTNNIIGNNQDLSKTRMNVCFMCDVHHNNWCIKDRGGCGCYLPAKTTVESEKCPINKW